MPSKIVDLSARSEIIRDEPFHLHFCECTPCRVSGLPAQPAKNLVRHGHRNPRGLPDRATIENHDWLEANTNGLQASSAGPVIICNTGGGNVGRAVYRIISYAHVHDDIGKFKKTLLHPADKQER